jgi:two-component system response regulator TctD
MPNPPDYSTTAPHRRVLCADDNIFVRKAICFALSQAKYAVECVADGREALERIEAANGAFQILVTDHYMPNLSGLELVRLLVSQKRPLEIIVVSGGLNPEAKNEYMRLGVRKIIEKPFFADEIIEALESISPE